MSSELKLPESKCISIHLNFWMGITSKKSHSWFETHY